MIKQRALGGLFSTLCLSVLSGCTSLTGLQDARSDFACPMSEGVHCASVSDVHQQTSESNNKSVITEALPEPTETETVDAKESLLNYVIPRRQAEIILRIWYAPYVDAAGDLHDQHYLYTTTRPAGWTENTLSLRAEGEPRLLTPLNSKIDGDKAEPYRLDRRQIKECTLTPLNPTRNTK